MSKSAELIKAGDLAGARAELVAQVKARPTDAALRFEFAELLLVLGEWDRADNQFDLVSTQDVSYGMLVALIRQLIRGELARAEVFTAGRTPELIGDATEEVEAALKLLLELREGGDAGAVREAADAAAPSLSGTVDGKAFAGIRDLDDRTADVLEVLTSTGKYYWIPWSRIRSLELKAPERLRDLVWRAADLDVADGPEGVVYIPATYVAQAEEQTGASRLGQETRWVEEGGIVRGVGLRCLLAGEDEVALSEFTTLALDGAA